jgi:hypothetical protein
MVPHDLVGKTVDITLPDQVEAVLLTGGTSERYLRLGYRIQEEFPGLLKAWYAYEPVHTTEADESLISRAIRKLHDVGIGPAAARYAVGLVRSNLRQKRDLKTLGNTSEIETRIFGDDVSRLRDVVERHPEIVRDIRSPDFISSMQSIRPYFLFVLGGPLLPTSILQSVQGYAINQHAGWSPELKGSRTTEFAMYHRRVDYIGSTVHLMTTAADAGAILRRSHATLNTASSVTECFLRAVALGSELMIQAVADMLHKKVVTLYEQPPGGITYRGVDFDETVISALADDSRRDWLAHALAKERQF